MTTLPVVLFIMLYKVVLTFESVDEILKCDHLSESCLVVLSCGTVYYVVPGGSNFWVCGWNPKVWPFKWKLLSSTFLWYWFNIMLYKVVLKFFSWEWILQCDHSNETSLAVLSCSISSFSAIYKINDILKVGKFWLLLLLGIKGLTIKTNFYTFNINPFSHNIHVWLTSVTTWRNRMLVTLRGLQALL